MARVAQLRTYRIADGRLDEFVQTWREGVVPLRRALGFRLEGAWTIEDESRFVWVISMEGTPDDFRQRDTAYYASPERQALDPDPADLVELGEHVLMTPVEPPGA